MYLSTVFKWHLNDKSVLMDAFIFIVVLLKN